MNPRGSERVSISASSSATLVSEEKGADGKANPTRTGSRTPNPAAS